MKYRNIISLILIFNMLIAFAVPVVHAEDAWDGWSMPSAVVKNADATVSVSDNAGTLTNIIKYRSFSNDFDVEFSMRVDSFSSETGIQVLTGKYRLYMNFGEGQITYFTGDGATNVKATLSYNIGTVMHDYRISVSGAKASVFIDDNFVGNIIIQTKTDSSPRMMYWVKGTSAKSAAITVSEMKYTSTTVAAEVPYDERKEVKLDMSSLEEFDVVTDGGVRVSDGYVHMRADAPGTAYSIRKYAGIDRDFDFDFRYRLVSSYGEAGAQVIWNGHRILIYFMPDYCRILTKDGQYRYSYGRSVLNEWHDYRVEVRGDYATLYMDGELMSSYELMAWSSDRPYFAFWLNRKDQYYETAMDIDNVHLVPYTYKAELNSPREDAVYISGSEILCQVRAFEGDEAVYYANGAEIGRAKRENGYRFLWSASPGKYQITASNTDGTVCSDIVRITVVPPIKVSAELPKTARAGETVEVTVSGGSLFSRVERTELYLDGILYSSKDGCAKSMQIDGLSVGTHNIFAKYILKNGLESVSENRQICVETEDVLLSLPDSYEVSFSAAGNGEAVCRVADGRYRYEFILNERGRYSIVVNCGVFYLYKDGKMQSSGRMEQSAGNGIELEENGLTFADFKVSGAKGVYSYIDTEPVNNEKYKLYNLGQEYAVEFTADGEQGGLSVYDGVYALLLKFSRDGITCKTSLGGKGDEEETVIWGNFNPEFNYRIQISRGIAQLFENNSFAASFRIVEDYALVPHMKAENVSYVQVKNADTPFEFYENFDTDTDCWNMKNNGWTLQKDGENGYVESAVGDSRALLAYGFAKNPKLGAKIKVDNGQNTGGIYLTARNNTEYAYMYVGYDFAQKSYVVREVYSTDTKTIAANAGEFPTGGWADVEAVFNDNRFELYVNNELKLSAESVSYIGFGRFGLIADGVRARADDFRYIGEGNVTAGIYDTTLPDIMNIELTQLTDGSLMYLGAYGKNQRSSDGGFTWTAQGALPYSSETKAGNIIRLKSGRYLMMTRCKTGTDKYLSHVYLSADGLTGWDGPYAVEGEAKARVSMNGKLDQMSDGRIFFVSGELAEGIEEHSIFSVYYSDDEGKKWKKSETEFNSFKTFRNLQECKVVSVGKAGHLRLYGRTEYGYIYYCDSYDNGVTWEQDFKPSQLAAPMNAFNIRLDPYTGKSYAFWTYDNKNDYGNKQYPRLRIALAVSSDNQTTWDYIMDVDEFEYGTTNFNRFQNLSLDFTEEAIYLNFIRNAPTASNANAITSRVVRIERDKIKTLGRFPSMHIRNQTEVPAVIRDMASKSIYTIPGSNSAVINGYLYTFDKEVYLADTKSVLGEALELYFNRSVGDEEYVQAGALFEMADIKGFTEYIQSAF